jgi:hypothetical protein
MSIAIGGVRAAFGTNLLARPIVPHAGAKGMQMSEVNPQQTTANGHDLANWMTVWMRSTHASSADVMRLVAAFNESWIHALTDAQESEARFRQTLLAAHSPGEAAAAYGSWCLAVAEAARQENQKLLQTGMNVLAERTQQAFSGVHQAATQAAAAATPAAKQPPGN